MGSRGWLLLISAALACWTGAAFMRSQEKLSSAEAELVLKSYQRVLWEAKSAKVIETVGSRFRRTWRFEKPDTFRAEIRVVTSSGKVRTLLQSGAGTTSYTLDAEAGFSEKLSRKPDESPLSGFDPFFSSRAVVGPVFRRKLEGKEVFEIRLKEYSVLLDTGTFLPVALQYGAERHLLECSATR